MGAEQNPESNERQQRPPGYVDELDPDILRNIHEYAASEEDTEEYEKELIEACKRNPSKRAWWKSPGTNTLTNVSPSTSGRKDLEDLRQRLRERE